jgi:hypothetical protein
MGSGGVTGQTGTTRIVAVSSVRNRSTGSGSTYAGPAANLAASLTQVSVRPRGNRASRVSTVPVEKQDLAKMDLMQSYSDYLQVCTHTFWSRDLRIGRIGIRVGDELTRLFRHARPVPSPGS